MPDMALLALRGRKLSEGQMPTAGTLRRRNDPSTPSASGGQASGYATGSALPLRISAVTAAQLTGAASLMSRTPDATIRVPVGTGLADGDRIDLGDGRTVEVVGRSIAGSYDTDEHAFVVQVN